ncbi:MAG: electron transfer flavoprotein subunit beta/FixA family protein [Actinobacteria bacterium]|nr:electron transfer flavoprotein subunit beta/FixA family protein [Actinomycetota bacterium]
MNVVVCIKHVPDPNAPVEIQDNRIKRDGVQSVLDPGDMYGIEAGLLLKEALGGEVAVVSMGPAQAVEAVKRALSMGADRGVLISDDALAGADSLITARVLAAVIRRADFDLVIAGVESTDGYTGTMPSSLAEILGLPQVTFAKSLTASASAVRVDRQTADGYHVVECPLPALVTVTAGVNEPRYPSFKGIMAAKKKPLEHLTLGDLGITGADAEVKQEIVAISPVDERKSGAMVAEDEAAARIADLLAEAKAI